MGGSIRSEPIRTSLGGSFFLALPLQSFHISLLENGVKSYKMARNEEKQMGRLNRLLLDREKQDFLKKHPKRPHLFTLNTADEIKQWLPSIKSDIDFCLKQSMVPCYTDAKVQEYMDEVAKLEKEYKCFVRKLRTVDPGTDEVPWTNRPYKRKKQPPEPSLEGAHPLVLPVLDRPHCVPKEVPPPEPVPQPNPSSQDEPLRFSQSFRHEVARSRKEYEENKDTQRAVQYQPRMGFEDKLRAVFGMDGETRPKSAKVPRTNVLGIDYPSDDE